MGLYIYIYIYIERERVTEREKERERGGGGISLITPWTTLEEDYILTWGPRPVLKTV
jgi:hypothetical protein